VRRMGSCTPLSSAVTAVTASLYLAGMVLGVALGDFSLRWNFR
jgi:hypothetical protein